MLTDKTLLITGAASGIGRQTAALAQECGARVISLVRDEREGHSIAEFTSGKDLLYADVSRAAEVSAAAAGLAAITSSIDAVVHCAGIWRRAGLLETTEDIWNECMSVNLAGSFHVAKAFLPLVAAGGSLTMVSSHFGIQKGHPKAPAYQASKAGVAGLTRSLAIDFADRGVRVNCVAPGLIDTPMTAQGLATPEIANHLLAGIPLRRPGQAVEVARVLVFLASDWASYITGQVIGVDGGSTAI